MAGPPQTDQCLIKAGRRKGKRPQGLTDWVMAKSRKKINPGGREWPAMPVAILWWHRTKLRRGGNIQTRGKRWMIGWMNLHPASRGATQLDSRNLTSAFYLMSVHGRADGREGTQEVSSHLQCCLSSLTPNPTTLFTLLAIFDRARAIKTSNLTKYEHNWSHTESHAYFSWPMSSLVSIGPIPSCS